MAFEHGVYGCQLLYLLLSGLSFMAFAQGGSGCPLVIITIAVRVILFGF